MIQYFVFASPINFLTNCTLWDSLEPATEKHSTNKYTFQKVNLQSCCSILHEKLNNLVLAKITGLQLQKGKLQILQKLQYLLLTAVNKFCNCSSLYFLKFCSIRRKGFCYS